MRGSNIVLNPATVEHIVSSPGEETSDYDWFHLNHLQSVRSDSSYYLNQKFIGKGGNGTTFLVTCTAGPNCGVQFALKVFHRISDARRRERFLEEIRHYKSLSHPSIIKVYDEGSYRAGDRSYPFAVMDFVPENLESKLGRGLPQIPRIEAVRYAFNIASGVGYLHSQSHPIVHRDIKPANILVSGQTARLGDLGLAKALMGGEEETAEDVAAYVAMPRFYRSPELVRIARGEKVELTVASDIYQLGLVLYRAVTGFNAQKAPPQDSLLANIELDIRSISGAGGERLDRLFQWILVDDPLCRPTAAQLLQELGLIHKEVCEADYSATGIMR